MRKHGGQTGFEPEIPKRRKGQTQLQRHVEHMMTTAEIEQALTEDRPENELAELQEVYAARMAQDFTRTDHEVHDVKCG